MTHADRMIAFFKNGIGEEVSGFWECEKCYEANTKGSLINEEVHFTCSLGHENIQ